MKKLLIALCVASFVILAFVSCSCDAEKPVYTISFETLIDAKVDPIQVEEGNLIPIPATLSRDGYSFHGWYNGDKPWNFQEETVTQDITLTAKWERQLSYVEATDGSGGLWVVGCVFDVRYVVIPREYNGRPVTGIYQGFADRTVLEKVDIPDTVTYISENAFAGCTGLKEINIPKSVTKIEQKAFYGCTSLTMIYCEANERPSGWQDDFDVVFVDDKTSKKAYIPVLYGIKQ